MADGLHSYALRGRGVADALEAPKQQRVMTHYEVAAALYGFIHYGLGGCQTH